MEGGGSFVIFLDVDGIGASIGLIVGGGVVHVLVVARGGATASRFSVSGAAAHSPLGRLVEKRLVLKEGEEVVVVGVIAHFIEEFYLILSTNLHIHLHFI